MLSSASDKAKLFAENYSKNSNLVDSGISLSVFPSRPNLKLDKISVTPKVLKKVIMNLDLLKASGPDCIPVVVLKNCKPELSYILVDFFNKCLKESKLLNNLRNFNGIFRNDVAYDNIKSHKKPGFHSLFRRYFF